MSRFSPAKPVTSGNIVEVPVPSPSAAHLIELVERELEQEHGRRAARVRDAMKGIERGGMVEHGYAIEM